MTKLRDNDWEQINEVIREINSVRENKEMRAFFLDIVKELIDYDLAIFDLSKVKDAKFVCLYDPVVKSRFDKTFEDNFISKYDNQYSQMSYTKWIYSEKKPIVYNETDVINESVRKNSQFYSEYLEPEGLIYCCGCTIVHEGINFGAVTFYRTSDHNDFNERDMYILEQLQPHLINKLSQTIEVTCDEDARTGLIKRYQLTNREAEIIDLVYLGFGNKDIGEKLFISVNTVKKHMSNIFSKIEVKSRSQLSNFLNEFGFNKKERK